VFEVSLIECFSIIRLRLTVADKYESIRALDGGAPPIDLVFHCSDTLFTTLEGLDNVDGDAFDAVDGCSK
jgi:hypothetical protein